MPMVARARTGLQTVSGELESAQAVSYNPM